MIGRASSMQEGELQGEWLVWGVADIYDYPKQRMDNATLTTGIRFVALYIIILLLCIITLSWTSTTRGNTGHCVGYGTNAIVGNADVAILHNALAIIIKPAFELGSKITSFMWTNSPHFPENNQIRTLL